MTKTGIFFVGEGVEVGFLLLEKARKGKQWCEKAEFLSRFTAFKGAELLNRNVLNV